MIITLTICYGDSISSLSVVCSASERVMFQRESDYKSITNQLLYHIRVYCVVFLCSLGKVEFRGISTEIETEFWIDPTFSESAGNGHRFVCRWWIPLHTGKDSTEKGRRCRKKNCLALTTLIHLTRPKSAAVARIPRLYIPLTTLPHYLCLFMFAHNAS